MRPRLNLASVAAALLLAGVLLVPQRAAAQGNCTRNGNGVCAVGATATYGLTLTITRAARLVTSTTTLTLPAPSLASYDAGFGDPALVQVTAQANTPWTLALAGVDATWTAGPGARANKPVADLQWSYTPAGAYTDLTQTDLTVFSGTATAGTNGNLYFRVRYDWTLDSPGAYSLPIRLVLTAP